MKECSMRSVRNAVLFKITCILSRYWIWLWTLSSPGSDRSLLRGHDWLPDRHVVSWTWTCVCLRSKPFSKLLRLDEGRSPKTTCGHRVSRWLSVHVGGCFRLFSHKAHDQACPCADTTCLLKNFLLTASESHPRRLSVCAASCLSSSRSR